MQNYFFLEGHSDSINQVIFPKNCGMGQNCLFSASDDGTTRVWDLSMNKLSYF